MQGLLNMEVTYLAILTLLLFTAAPKAEGCSCERLHPQQHFCSASYVIGARILKRDYVRLNLETNNKESDSGLLGYDHDAIEPPNIGGGLHSLPNEPQPGGVEPSFFEEFEPLPYPDGLEPLPHPERFDPDGLFPLAGHGGLQYQPEGLEPLPFPESYQPLPPGSEFLPALQPLPELKPVPEGLQPNPQPAGLQPLPEGLQPAPEPTPFLPLPHPEGLEPAPEGLQPYEEPPALPLPEDLKPSGQEDTTLSLPSTAGEVVEGTLDSTTSLPEGTIGNETFTYTPYEEPNEPDVSSIDPHSMESWNYKLVYTVKLTHLYKTGVEQDGWKIGDEVQIETSAASSMCGSTELKLGKNYLISGAMPGRVRICDWIQDHSKLTSRQKQGLKTIYGKSCDVCQIHACPSYRHCKKPKKNRSTTCLYDASQVQIGAAYSSYDCIASHSRCTLRGGRKCKWQKNNNYHDCMKYQLP